MAFPVAADDSGPVPAYASVRRLPGAVRLLAPGAPRAQWLAARRRGIGGSDVLAVLGMHPWTSGYEMWLDKTGRVPDRPFETPRQRWGRRMEPLVAEWFSDETGVEVVPAGMWRSSTPGAGWARCNPDRLTADHAAGVEIKTVAAWARDARQWRREVPDYPAAQAQWCMAVTGLRRWWVVALPDGEAPIIHQLDRDEQIIRDLWECAGAWWHRHVLGDEAPPVDDRPGTGAALDLAQRGSGVETDIGVRGALALMARRQIKAEQKALQGQLDDVENTIKAMLVPAGAEYGTVDGRRRVRHARRTRTNVNNKLLRDAHPGAWNAVTSESTYAELREVTK